MTLSLNPELQRFVDEKVKAGEYASAAQVVEAGLARLMLDPPPEELDEQDLAQIRESFAQMRRGEVLDWAEFSTKLRERYLGK